MWLLDTTTLELHEFIGKKPPYAILSHRWTNDRVTFKDVLKRRAGGLPGWQKVQGFCGKARAYELNYGWVDTCCIDKKSSAELSEAINSMFAYYAEAKVCFVYLEDVRADDDQCEASFIRSEWFTRGWTLQELVAPKQVEFCDRQWEPLGPLTSWRPAVEQATGIRDSESLPLFADRYNHPSIARRMCWASRRKVTRAEDESYCLLGLFRVNMPLLYGEGRARAFERLQREILKRTDDDSIFCWDPEFNPFYLSSGITRNPNIPLLAPTIGHFSGASNIYNFVQSGPIFSVSNLSLGWRSMLGLYLPDGENGPHVFYIDLLCRNLSEDNEQSRFKMYLIKTAVSFLRFGPLQILPPYPSPAESCPCATDLRSIQESLAPNNRYQHIQIDFEPPQYLPTSAMLRHSKYLDGFTRQHLSHHPACYWQRHMRDLYWLE